MANQEKYEVHIARKVAPSLHSANKLNIFNDVFKAVLISS